MVSLAQGLSGSLGLWVPTWSLGLQELIGSLGPQELPGPRALASAGMCWGPGFKGAHWEPLWVTGVGLVLGWAVLESSVKWAPTSLSIPRGRVSTFELDCLAWGRVMGVM